VNERIVQRMLTPPQPLRPLKRIGFEVNGTPDLTLFSCRLRDFMSMNW